MRRTVLKFGIPALVYLMIAGTASATPTSDLMRSTVFATVQTTVNGVPTNVRRRGRVAGYPYAFGAPFEQTLTEQSEDLGLHLDVSIILSCPSTMPRGCAGVISPSIPAILNSGAVFPDRNFHTTLTNMNLNALVLTEHGGGDSDLLQAKLDLTQIGDPQASGNEQFDLFTLSFLFLSSDSFTRPPGSRVMAENGAVQDVTCLFFTACVPLGDGVDPASVPFILQVRSDLDPPPPMPEPSSFALLLTGLAGVAWYRKKYA